MVPRLGRPRLHPVPPSCMKVGAALRHDTAHPWRVVQATTGLARRTIFGCLRLFRDLDMVRMGFDRADGRHRLYAWNQTMPRGWEHELRLRMGA